MGERDSWHLRVTQCLASRRVVIHMATCPELVAEASQKGFGNSSSDYWLT